MRYLPLCLAAAMLVTAAPHATALGDLECYGSQLDVRAQHPYVEVCPPTQP
jgi:hypothetical protein